MARPKRVLLSVSASTQSGSLRRFLLENKGYQVFHVTNAEDALALLKQWAPAHPAAMMTDLNLGTKQPNGNELCRLAKEIVRTLPTLVLMKARDQFPDGPMQCDRLLRDPGSVELLETLKVLSGGKRGPKPRGQERMQPMKALPAHVWTRREERA